MQQASTATTLAASTNPLTQGQPITLTATVRSDSPNASNTVNFFDGSNLIGTSAINASGTAILTPPSLTLGTHALTVAYTGDLNHAGSTSVAVPELVVQSASLSLSSSVNPSVSGQNVIITGQIQGSPVPSGSLALRDKGTLLATIPLNAAGIASFATTGLSVGTHDISVTYSGDASFSTAESAITQSVLNAGTTTALSVRSNPATYGAPLLFSATVSSNGGPATGTMNFVTAGTLIGSAQLDSSGNAAFTTSTLVPGTHTVQASYLGDGKASPSDSAPLALRVEQLTAVALRSNGSPAET